VHGERLPGSAPVMETSEDPRGTDVGQAGYPEEQHEGAQPGGGDQSRDRRDKEAPSTSSDEDSGSREATGNPGAAGG
jgi:hypothetical protein